MVVNSVEDFIGGYKRKIGQLKLSGVMSLVEGKQPVPFDGYRFLHQYYAPIPSYKLTKIEMSRLGMTIQTFLSHRHFFNFLLIDISPIN